ncbi:EAL domain-containing protein [Magnetovibrio sp. PR-2]|uniref:EAL domain-containing protein n=1 Tax=Magnetovibrio sp. PR-2 TaxID=3120356 RepID=UPI002FCDFA57
MTAKAKTTDAAGGAAGDNDKSWARALLDSLPNDLAVLIRGGRITDINTSGAQILGYDNAEQAVGEFFADLVDPEDLGAALPYLTGEARANQELSVYLTTDRLSAPVQVIISSTKVEGDEEALALHGRRVLKGEDLSQHSLMGSDLYRYLFDHSQAMICVLDEEGYILMVNDATVNTLGHGSSAKLAGKPFLQIVHPDYHNMMNAGLDIIAEETTPLPLKLLKTNEHNIDAEVTFSPIGDGQYMVEARDITERTRTAATLQEREQRLRGILDTVADAIITINAHGEVMAFNMAAESIFGYEAREVIGHNISMLVGSEHAHNHDQYIANYIDTGKPKIIDLKGREETGRRKDGTEFALELAVTELRHGTKRFFTGVVRDITERKEHEEQIRRHHDELEMRVEERTRELTQEILERRRAEDKLRLAGEVIEALNEGVVIINPDFRISSINPAYTSISGYESGEVLGNYPINHTALSQGSAMFDDMWSGLEMQGRWEGEFWNLRKSGEEYAERLSVTAITSPSGEVMQFAAIISDITKRKQDEERILYQANYDSLTGLPNRSLFLDRLTQAINTMSRTDKNLALLFIDLDGFKLVNDTLGHDVGDMLLKETAKRLGTCVRTGDTVARLGGDEFTIIMPNLDDARNAPLVAQRVLDSLGRAFLLSGHEAFVSGSIGITIYPDDADDASDLLKNADAAMYRAKEEGKANFQFFTVDMNEQVQERMVLKNGLTKALENQEFNLLYQPKLDLVTNRVTSAEALMRWQNPELGLVSPVRFIPILEETGMVVEVGEWAIHTACKQHKAWLRQGLPPIKVAVNLSARQLRDPNFVDIVKSALKRNDLPPSAIEIEITESMLMSDATVIVAALEDLHNFGIHISMDDFGTGYSSLSYLKRFPIDTIKIDRSFVNDIHTSTDDAEIIHTIINMGHTLNRKIIAEGVEIVEQLDILKEYNCDEIQGYYFSKPLSSEDFTTFIGELAKSWTD